MGEQLEKADFYLETEEYSKAENIYSELFEQNNENADAIIGIIICKIFQSDFENNQFKACRAYHKKIDTNKLSAEQRDKLVSNILDGVGSYLDKVLTKFREHAHELSKRPAYDGQLYNIKQLGDATDYMGFINDNVDKLEDGLEFASIAYDIAKDKEKVAYQILELHDKVFNNFRDTPNMQGKTLLEAKDLKNLKEKRKLWLDRSGEHKSKVQADPSDSSGCLVLIISLATIGSSLVGLLIAFL